MNSALRDRQALKRLRKMETSASLRLGEHITKAISKPWRFPILPLTFLLLVVRIAMERLGWIEPPESRVEWKQFVEGKGLVVYVDGYLKSHVEEVKQDIEDFLTFRKDIVVSVVCTTKYQNIFSEVSFPVFVLPEKSTIYGERMDDWGILLEEQIGGISSFFNPSMVLIVGPYPHRAIKNLVRSNPAIQLIHDQRPGVKLNKKYPNNIFTHLSGVLRSRSDTSHVPDSTEIHRVDNLGMSSWLSSAFGEIDLEYENMHKFNEQESRSLIELSRNANRDTSKISTEIDRLNVDFGIERVHSLLRYTLINLELNDETRDKRITRDLFVAAIRSLGKTNFEHMLELSEWRIHRYQDERAAKSVIQFLRNAERFEEAAAYLKYVKVGEWKKREIQTVTSRLLAQYENNASEVKGFETLGDIEVEAIIRAELEQNNLARVKKELTSPKGGINRKMKVLQQILKASVEIHDVKLYNAVKDCGMFEHNSAPLARRLNTFFLFYGDTLSAMKALELGPDDELGNDVIKTQGIIDKINSTWLKSLGPITPKSRYKNPVEGKVLYLAHMALPFESAGYCTRTHGLLTNLSNLNPLISVQTRLGYPLDKGKLRHLTEDDVEKEFQIDGLTYHYHKTKDVGISDSDEKAYIERAALALVEQAQLERPALIQAASNHVNGAIGYVAARALDLPFIYEVRGLWHMSRVARQPLFYHHAEYDAMDLAEIALCKKADFVLAITHAVRFYLIEKGVNPERILVLPNGVDTNRFLPTNQNHSLKQELKLKDNLVIGYVGSFVKYEGLDLLIEAFSKLRERHTNVFLLMVGDGETRPELEQLTEDLDIQNSVKFTGRVPHSEVLNYHSVIDIAPFPRTPDIVCEFISPLKPFESMAMGQVVVGSDVAALKEIIDDGRHGRLFRKGDSDDLFEVLSSLVSNPDQITRLKQEGLEWVRKNRDWGSLASYLHEVHQSILMGRDTPQLLGTGQALTIMNGTVSTVIDRKPNLMVIMDEFSTTALNSDANLIRPTPQTWEENLNDNRIDMLLVESAWEGNDGSWHRKVGWYSDEEINELENLIDACRNRKIPTVFYNKEDPVHFKRFSRTSELFDHVFTTDEGCIDRYKALKGSNNQSIDWIQFAAQPSVHHPYGVKFSDRRGIAFAGTYYAGKYPDRCKKMDMLFDAAKEHDLVIYDRQSDGGNPQYVFPERFKHHIHGRLEYQEMLQKHREHKIFLNVNSVEDSRTMAARRIFEIPASGSCLVSGPGLAVREVFGNTVPIVDTEKQAKATISALISDENYLHYTIQSSRQIVMKRHLNVHRLQKMLSASNMKLQGVANAAEILQIEDATTSILEICLWIARQETTFKCLVLPSEPSTKAEELLINLLRHRGISITHDKEAMSNLPAVVIFNVSAFDHTGLETLINEMKSTSSTIHFRSPSGDLLATCRKFENMDEVELEHYSLPQPQSFSISSIKAHTFTEIPSTILIAGHDLKFAKPILEVMKEMGISVLVDRWENHNKFDAEKSRRLLAQADAVWCEWALGNIEWYSKAVKEGTPLFVRYHLQERNYDYLSNSDQSKITNVSFVCKHYENHAREIKQIDENTQTSVIPNVLRVKGNYLRKNDNYSIGFVGMVPSRKRLDLALDLIEYLLQYDSRYTLKVVGKRPEEYSWLMKRDEEKQYYDAIQKRISANPLLESKVEYLGFVDDIREFYSSVGHVVSTSDFESFHLTLADGPIHGAAAHTLPWDGSSDIYTEAWLNDDVEQMGETIQKINNENKTGYHAYLQAKHLVKQMSPEVVALSIISALMAEAGTDE